jgi:inner membrane protein
MPTAFTHAFVAAAAGKVAFARPMPPKFWLLSVLCATMPDLDVGLFAYGIQYEDLWGHRGMMHSLLFALVTAIIVASWPFRKEAPLLSGRWWALTAYFFFVTASHGLLDAFTNGGLGIAFFTPFYQKRFFFPWTRIEVSPMGLQPLFSREGWEVVRSELIWVWIPTSIIALTIMLSRAMMKKRPVPPA